MGQAGMTVTNNNIQSIEYHRPLRDPTVYLETYCSVLGLLNALNVRVLFDTRAVCALVTTLLAHLFQKPGSQFATKSKLNFPD